jgi:hypothetical protein
MDHSSAQKMDHGTLEDHVTYDEEFRLAIRAIPIREITLHVWDIAKSRGSHVMPVGRPPMNRRELLQYLGVIADFKRTTKYKTLTYDTLEALAKSATAWNWDANACPLQCRGTAIPTEKRKAVEDISGCRTGSSRQSPDSRKQLSTTDHKESTIQWQKSISRRAADCNAAFPESSRGQAGQSGCRSWRERMRCEGHDRHNSNRRAANWRT